MKLFSMKKIILGVWNVTYPNVYLKMFHLDKIQD